jgi:phosphocarrier protein
MGIEKGSGVRGQGSGKGEAGLRVRACDDGKDGVAERIESKVTIVNRLGLHARPAMTFVDLAMQFTSAVTVKRGEQAVDGKSIMQMMMLAATKGTELCIVCEGDDATKAAEALMKLVSGGFEEE